ncbi:phage portal protein [Nocardia vinacea]|uniref:Phage portal protein n=1 Tax=Nocardia vinacea TaxID=96468 RepID=A0ABZ1YHV8_9NOCA|nr:phage portal protein [Nocardia vinacea]
MANPIELTPDQWLEYLMNKLDEDLEREPRVTTDNTPTTRRERLELLWSYYLGDPPLPTVAEKYRETFAAVLRKSRSNYAIMAIDSMCDRSVLQGIYTAADADLNGDDAAKLVCDASGFAALQRDMQTWLYTMGESYVTIVAPLAGAPEGSVPMLLAEDPRYCVGEPDPLNPRYLRAFLKIFVDKLADQQKVILLTPGQRHVFAREPGQYSTDFVADQWTLEETTSTAGLEMFGGVPVVRFVNKMGLGEFEPHLDLLDRITDGILHRMVITAFQSFKQRAVKGDLDGGADFSEDTDSIIKSIADADLTDIFQNDPGVLWMLPEGVELWESGTTDLTPLLMATRDDVKEFGVCTRIPMHMLAPDGVSQTAEGASAMREGLVDKISDRQARQDPQWILLWQMVFTLMGKAGVTGIRLQWGKPERVSLAARTDAVQKTRGVLSRRRQVVELLEMSPELAALSESELLEEAMASDAAMSQLSLGTAPTGESTATDEDLAA